MLIYMSLKKINNPPPKFDKVLKVVLVGEDNVGKSSFLDKYLHNKFTDDYNSTVGSETKILCCSYQDTTVKFQICDIAGQEKYKPSLNTFYKGMSGAIIMFSLEDIDSFLSVKSWFKEIDKYKMKDIPIVIVGNKSDSPDLKIKEELLREFAEEYECKFTTISVKNEKNLNRVFELLV
jgi:small GTP-binding protein